MTYDVLGPGPLDYLPCRYGTSKLMFRGPKRDLADPFIAFIGTTETYGKFIEAPFPTLLEGSLGITCVNFGQITAGIDAFATDPYVIQAACDARVTVIQIMGAQNMTNRFYSVHPRRNDRFTGASSILKTIYRDVDFADFHFNKHLLTHLKEVSYDRFEAVQHELREAWLARMQFLLRQIQGKTVLLWMSGHAPKSEAVACDNDMCVEPMLVTREMIEKVTPYASAYAEVVASPQALQSGMEGMVFSELDEPAATEMLRPLAHAEAASALTKAIQNLI